MPHRLHTTSTPHRTDGDQRDALQIEDVVIRPVRKICGGWMICLEMWGGWIFRFGRPDAGCVDLRMPRPNIIIVVLLTVPSRLLDSNKSVIT